jgi:hypothetical protein
MTISKIGTLCERRAMRGNISLWGNTIIVFGGSKNCDILKFGIENAQIIADETFEVKFDNINEVTVNPSMKIHI